ncbi:MFS transporter [Rothia kristinae]|uniref:MFS transporter n=1 Tax=Rothia kristinae TaxID=37923 RepID=UPI0007372AD3|nr:MFS transporter [Rothia kristinae]KTR39390.1 hypothetical protein RSA5_02450 [Rothia kristinae]KTR66867.1 hypothetical protein SA12R_07255 [Rothia kristinae]KTR73626.1 hypothetical protein SA15R_04020 [Rothia kristinae]KTR74876.1 hypothetical protein SA14R_08925 [Rothia kristinae]KTR80945.1 hypothetical protein RSA28_03880 [Rothia kristinae]
MRTPPATAPGSTGSFRIPPAARAGTAWARLRVLARLVGLGYLGVTVFARLPVAMLPLGTLVMIASWTRQVLLAGYAAGAVALALAVSVPLYGMLARRVGQRVVLLFCSVANTAALLWLIYEADRVQRHPEIGIGLLLAACAVTGATCAPVAALARIRWAGESQRLADRSLLNSSLAFESVADVLTLLLGAAVTGLSCVIGGPHTGLLMVVPVNVVGVLAFAFFRLRHPLGPTSPPPEPEAAAEDAARRSLMWLPVVGMGALGLLLGSMQSSLVSYTMNFDAVQYVGLLYAVLGGSSLVSAVIVVGLRARTNTWGAWLLWACLLTLVGMPVSMPTGDATLALSLVVEGAVVGVALIVTDSVVMSIAPVRCLDLVLTSALASLLAGNALGLAWGAVLGDSLGYNSALMLPVLSAGAYLLLAHLYGYLWRQRFERRETDARLARHLARRDGR